MGARLSEGFLDHAKRRPDLPALIWRGSITTYGELASLARAATPVDETGQPMAIVARKSPATVAAVLAGLMAGRPVFLPSPELPPDVLRRLLEDAGCGSAAAALGPDIALMLTTSGSTGAPKVVPLTHGGILRFAAWAASRFDIRSGTTVLSYAPLNFDLSLLDVWTTLEHGGCVALVDPDHAMRGTHLLRTVAEHDVAVVQGVPMLYRLLLDAARREGPYLERVAHAIFTGDHLPRTALAALPRLFPAARLSNVYGCTETNDSFIHELVDPPPTDGPLPIGTALPGVEAHIVGADGRIVQGAGRGELVVATPFQTPGYLPAGRNEGRFVRRPDRDGACRYFRTGDLVSRTGDGVVTLEGRLDALVKVRGVGVFLPAVEGVIADHPHVVEVAVVAVEDELAGRRLHAVVRRRGGSDLNSLAVRRHCARFLGGPAIPSSIEIVTTPLARTATGKVDRRRLSRPRERSSDHD